MAAMNVTVYVLFRTRLIFPPINGPKNIIDMSALMTRVGRNGYLDLIVNKFDQGLRFLQHPSLNVQNEDPPL